MATKSDGIRVPPLVRDAQKVAAEKMLSVYDIVKAVRKVRQQLEQ